MPADLAALQRRFYALAVGGGEVGEVDDDFVGTPGLSAAKRMQVYADMYLIRLLDTLAEYFPELRAALGDEYQDVARAYLAAHPPTSPSLRELGRALPAYLAGTRADLADLALLEWTRLDLFDGPDEETLDVTAVQSLDPAALAELPLALAVTARLLPNGTLVWRQDFHVHDRAVPPDEAPALARVAAGTRVGLLCDEIGDADVAFGFLSRWLADEILRLTTVPATPA